MLKLKPGQTVYLLCDMQPGAFTGERLVTIRTDRGVMSGFVKDAYLTTLQGRGYVEGTVLSVSPEVVDVRIPGSFFTTASGVTSVSSSWATDNFQLAGSIKSGRLP